MTETEHLNPVTRPEKNEVDEADTHEDVVDEFETRLPYAKAEGWSLNVIIIVAILGILSALLISFIIYAGATWNKEIINEYA